MPRRPKQPTDPSRVQDIASPVRQFAERLGISRHTVYRAIAAGRLKTIRIGATQLVLHESLKEDAA
jgi:excisionase family DNA binding protein